MFDTPNFGQKVRENPRIVGILFALMFLLAQAGTVSAGAVGAVSGP